MIGDRRITELSEVEFRGSLGAAFHDYAQRLYGLALLWAFELETASGDAQAAMESLHGHRLLFGVDVRVKARRIAKRLRRAHDLAYGMAVEAEKFHDAYQRHILGQAH